MHRIIIAVEYGLIKALLHQFMLEVLIIALKPQVLKFIGIILQIVEFTIILTVI